MSSVGGEGEDAHATSRQMQKYLRRGSRRASGGPGGKRFARGAAWVRSAALHPLHLPHWSEETRVVEARVVVVREAAEMAAVTAVTAEGRWWWW